MNHLLKMNLQLFAETEPPAEPKQEEQPRGEEPKPEPEDNKKEPPPSSPKSGHDEQIKHLTDLVQLVTEKVDKTFQAAKDTKEEMQEAEKELRETTALLQNLIGEVDHKLEQLGTIAAALVKLHKEAMEAAKKV